MSDCVSATTSPIGEMLRSRIAAAADMPQIEGGPLEPADAAVAKAELNTRFEQAVEVAKDTLRTRRRIQRRVWDTTNPAALLSLLAAMDRPGPFERVVWDTVARTASGEAVPTEEQLLAEIARQEVAMGDSPGDWTELVAHFVTLLKCAVRGGVDLADLVPLFLRRHIDLEDQATVASLAADPATAPPPPTSFTTDPLCSPARTGQSPGAAVSRFRVKVAVPA